MIDAAFFTVVEIPIAFHPRRRASCSPSRRLDRRDGPRRSWSGDGPGFPGPWTWRLVQQLAGEIAECWMMMIRRVLGAGSDFFMRE